MDKYQRIIIMGCPGGGKSTLARRLAEVTGLPIVHLDRLFWREGWQNVSRDEFDRLLAMELKKPAWIIDGNYSRTLPERLEACDLVIYLDFPRSVCLCGAVKRIISSYGKTRPDMGEGCPERFDLEFLRYIWNFQKKATQKLMTLLMAHQEKEIIILHHRKEIEAVVERLREEAAKA